MKNQRILFLSIVITLGISLELILGFVESVSYSWWRLFLVITCFGTAMGSFCIDMENDMILLAVFSLITFAINVAVNIVFINNYVPIENGSEEAVLVIYNSIMYAVVLKPLLIAILIFISLAISVYQFFISVLPLGIRTLYNKFVK